MNITVQALQPGTSSTHTTATTAQGMAASKPLSGLGNTDAATPLVDPATLSATRTTLDSAVASMQDFAQSIGRDLSFRLDDSTGQVVVQIMASGSGELIRQIPSEEALKWAANMDDLRSLLLRDEA
ncbi:flagellar protein FlaG [Azomonas macrocytogenes]|uniref:Flagellar protein FlaG n=1 Tax=Azomonas macrocytogenes TaxID=69962 RepID=A0A839T926_AZOMA|nr:flagellar protein FlaG [Azomonas macrocytogenes]MBB3104143.1 flagellar protein FlaG [Azomonas macrocytogenes]